MTKRKTQLDLDLGPTPEGPTEPSRFEYKPIGPDPRNAPEPEPEPTHTDEDVEAYRKALRGHDRWYMYSDDSRVYRRGRDSWNRVCALRKKLPEEVVNEVTWEVWPDTRPVDPASPWTCTTYSGRDGRCGGQIEVTDTKPYAAYGAKGIQHGTCSKCGRRSQLGRPITEAP